MLVSGKKRRNQEKGAFKEGEDTIEETEKIRCAL